MLGGWCFEIALKSCCTFYRNVSRAIKFDIHYLTFFFLSFVSLRNYFIFNRLQDQDNFLAISILICIFLILGNKIIFYVNSRGFANRFNVWNKIKYSPEWCNINIFINRLITVWKSHNWRTCYGMSIPQYRTSQCWFNQ